MPKVDGISEESVRRSLEPELSLIGDKDLRDKAVKAWTMSCRIGGYSRLEDVPTELYDRLPHISNLDHQKQATRMAKGIVDAIGSLAEGYINRDYVLTACLCHDVGKPCEWRAGEAGLYVDRTFYGPTPDMPQLEGNMHYQVARHPVWGLHIALSVGMPPRVAHAIAAHSREGDLFERSPEAAIVQHVDTLWWQTIGYRNDTKKSHWRERSVPRIKER